MNMDSGSSPRSGLPSSFRSPAQEGPSASMFFNSSDKRPENSSVAPMWGEKFAIPQAQSASDGLKTQKSNSSNMNPGLHNCVVRIRVEDQQLAEDVIEGLEFSRDRAMMSQLASHVNNIFLASSSSSPRRPNPSPLGSNARQPISIPIGIIQC